MPDTNLIRKLLLKPGTDILLLNAPPAYREAIAAHGVTVADGAAGSQFDLVQLFAPNRTELDAGLLPAIAATRPGGILWISYPKQTGAIKSDLNRDRVRELSAFSGWRPVTQISIDETWSALRFRPVEDVGKSG